MYNRENLILVGATDAIKMYVEYGAYLKILRYAKAGSVDGTRGVLLGKWDEEGIHIEEALEALYTGDEGLEAPSFTGRSWERIINESRENYPDYKILGQYSTHPGAEYTDMDVAMQQSFFAGGKSVLFLFDPIENTEAVYLYDKDFKKLGGMYLFDRYENEIDLKLKESIIRPVNREFEYRTKIVGKINKRLAAAGRVYAAVIAVLAVAVVYLMVQNTELYSKYDALDKKTRTMQSQMDDVELQMKKTPPPTPTPSPTPLPTPTPRANRVR